MLLARTSSSAYYGEEFPRGIDTLISHRRAAIPLLLLLLAPGPAAGEDHRESFRTLPAQPEVLYLRERFSACFSCHPPAMAEDEDFNVETGFRDTGLGKNLHWMHLFRQPQGTNCSACHRVDRESGRLFFSEGAGVTRSVRGGSCAPSCHRRKEYQNAGRPSR